MRAYGDSGMDVKNCCSVMNDIISVGHVLLELCGHRRSHHDILIFKQQNIS